MTTTPDSGPIPRPFGRYHIPSPNRPPADSGPLPVQLERTDDTLVLGDLQAQPPTSPVSVPPDLAQAPLPPLPTAAQAQRLADLPWERTVPIMTGRRNSWRSSRVIDPSAEPLFAGLLLEQAEARSAELAANELADWWVDCGLLNPDHEAPWVAHRGQPPAETLPPYPEFDAQISAAGLRFLDSSSTTDNADQETDNAEADSDADDLDHDSTEDEPAPAPDGEDEPRPDAGAPADGDRDGE